MGQFKGTYEEILHRMARETDLGKKIDVVTTTNQDYPSGRGHQIIWSGVPLVDGCVGI